jgi:hypothetical protein
MNQNSSLEQQTKTSSQIWAMISGVNHRCTPTFNTPLDKNWVLLEYHQAEVEKCRQQQKDDYEIYQSKVQKFEESRDAWKSIAKDSQRILESEKIENYALKEKIAEANKILDGKYYIENSKELIKRLREALK